MSIGKRVRDERQALGMSLAHLAKKTGIDVQTLRCIENGTQDINTLQLSDTAAALGVLMSNLVSDEPCEPRVRAKRPEDQDAIAWARRVFLQYRCMCERAQELGIGCEL